MNNILEIPFHQFYSQFDEHDALPLSDYNIEAEGQLYYFLITNMRAKIEKDGKIILKLKVNDSKKIINVTCRKVFEGLWKDMIFMGYFDCSTKYGLELLGENISFFEEQF